MQVKKYWLPTDNKTITNVLLIGKARIHGIDLMKVNAMVNLDMVGRLNENLRVLLESNNYLIVL